MTENFTRIAQEILQSAHGLPVLHWLGGKTNGNTFRFRFNFS